MKSYIGTKIIQAEPMNENTFRARNGRPIVAEDSEGYSVKYPDGYVSWSPKEQFEIAYREITENEKALI